MQDSVKVYMREGGRSIFNRYFSGEEVEMSVGT
jgi:hypothetical protein